MLSQPARMRCGKVPEFGQTGAYFVSQPARMRCGKEPQSGCNNNMYRVATRTNALWQSALAAGTARAVKVATRTNALWQRFIAEMTELWYNSRNPHECAVAKSRKQPKKSVSKVATRTNALWQSSNSLQRQAQVKRSQPARMRCGKANQSLIILASFVSQPARMRCGKGRAERSGQKPPLRRNPHECAVAKRVRSLPHSAL